MAKKASKAGKEVKGKSPLAIAREYLPDLNDEQLHNIIWGHTGFPSFWNIPKDGKTPEACFRKQLRKVQRDFRKWKKLTPEQRMEHLRKQMEQETDQALARPKEKKTKKKTPAKGRTK